MLNTIQWDHLTYKSNQEHTHREGENDLRGCEPDAKTTCIEVHQYLDFAYGVNSIDITLPDESTAKLVAGEDGRVYFQVPVKS